MCEPMNRVLASITHVSQSTASRFTVSGLSAFRLTASRLTASRWKDFSSIASESTTSKNSSKPDRWWPRSVYPNKPNYGVQAHLQTCSIMASQFISEFVQSLGLQAHLLSSSILAAKCSSAFTRSQSPSASPNAFDHGLQTRLHGTTAGVQRYRGNWG